MLSKEKTNSVSRIKVLLTLRGYKQSDAAKMLNITPASFSDKLNGHIRFSAEEISALADFFDVESDVLLGRSPLVVS